MRKLFKTAATILVLAPLLMATDLSARIAPPDSLEHGLVSHWRGNGNALDSKEANPGTIYGGVTFVPAMGGTGFRFNGTDGAVNIADSESLAITDSLTIAAWVKIERFPDLGQGAGMILFRGDDRAGLDPYSLYVAPSKQIVFQICSPSNESMSLSAPIAGQTFVHIAAVLHGKTGKIRLYENGKLVASTTSNLGALLGNLEVGSNAAVGLGNHGAQGRSGFHYPFCGIISDVRLYKRALDADEIHRLFRRSFAAPVVSRKIR